MPERLLKISVVLSTAAVIFVNWLSTTGAIGGYAPNVVSDMFPTLITPAGYAFAIWGLIYLGVIAFSIYQIFAPESSENRNIRFAYIFTCAANCIWIFLWHNLLIFPALFAMFALLGFLEIINRQFTAQSSYWVRAVFGVYFGWVTAASLVNLKIALLANGLTFPPSADIWISCGFITVAAVIGVLVNIKLNNAAYPLTIAWALTAIAVKQSTYKSIVFAATIGVVALLISALSFILRDSKKTA